MEFKVGQLVYVYVHGMANLDLTAGKAYRITEVLRNGTAILFFDDVNDKRIVGPANLKHAPKIRRR